MNPENETPTTGRNEPCPCGSGKKFKRCHGINAAPKVTPPAAMNTGGAGAPGAANPYEALSNMDPQVMMQFAQMMQRLPRGQIQRLQALMQKAMSGKDVTREAQEFERSLPPDFIEMMKGMNLAAAFGGQQPEAPVAPPGSEAPQMTTDQAKAIVEQAVAEGRLSPEEAQKLLGASGETPTVTPATFTAETASSETPHSPGPSDAEAGLSKFWKKLGGKKS